MKCLIKNVIIFSKIIKLYFSESFSTAIIKKSVYTSHTKKNLNRYRSSLKSPYLYSLNQNSLFLIKNLKNSKLFYNIINIHPSVFHNYSWCYNIKPHDFDISILKKKVNFLHQNLNSVLHNHLKTSLLSFHSDFRHRLKSYNSNIIKINNYIKDNSLKPIYNNNMLLSSVVETPYSTRTSKSSFYPRYVIFFNVFFRTFLS